MVSRKEKVRAGAFVVFSIVLLFSFLVFLKYYASFEESREYFFLYQGSVFGLDKGSKVAFNGVPVGTVSAIGFPPEDRSKIKVTLKITVPEDELPILDDTTALLKYVSLITGTLFVELKGGNGKVVHDPAQSLKVEYTILDDFEKKMNRLDTRVNDILVQVSDLLRTENRQKVTALLTDVQAASADLKDIAEGTQKAMASLDKALTTVQVTVDENRETLQKVFQGASASFERFNDVLGTVKEQKTVEIATETLKRAGEAASAVAKSGEQLAQTGRSLGESGKESLAKVDGLVKRLDEQLAATLDEAKKALQTTDQRMSGVSKAFEEAGKAALAFVQDSQAVVRNADKLLASTDALVSQTSKEVVATLEKIRLASEKVDQTVQTVNTLVVAKGPAVQRIVDDLRAAANELKEFASKIREQPSSLIGREPKDARKFGN
jgi:phospholipid/cholesterol/gamma-HCH transport system substrate-binding protein